MAEATCSVMHCTDTPEAKGWCNLHYLRAYRSGGDPLATPPELAERLWRQFRITEAGCWEWTHSLNRYGYGLVHAYGKRMLAHRFAYELLVEPIPDGLQIDHLCRNRACCNPTHLEPVTAQVNQLRGNGMGARHAAQTHCLRGHEFNEENTYIRKDSGARMCRICRNFRTRRARARLKDAA